MAHIHYENTIQQSATLVENAFITQYAGDAPPHGVAVYLLGLMECQQGTPVGDLDGFARRLGISPEVVQAAFSHWQSLGLVRFQEGADGISISYLPIPERKREAETRYPYQEFNREIIALFHPRQPTPGDMRRIYDWMDVFGIAQNAIPLLIQYGKSRMKGAETRSVSAQINYIHRIAEDWAENGVLSVQKAESWMREQERVQKGLYKLMGAMGMNRAATQSERKLFDSWLEMGFTVNGMIAALDRLTASYAPSFKRLGDVLADLKEQDVISTTDINRTAKKEEQLEQGASAMVTALGLKNPTPTAHQLEVYRTFVQSGLSRELILYGAERARALGKPNATGVKEVLEGWQGAGIATVSAAKKASAALDGDLAQVQEVLSRMGLRRKATGEMVEQIVPYQREAGMDWETILLAAERAKNGERPYALFLRILESYKEAGVTTVKQARQQEEKRTMKPQENKTPQRGLDYQQREYTEQELDALVFGQREEGI
ncbi:DnaD domain protein [Eubacteriales bacterium OttesenSCG-928-M02]|nr:DnaD domain protein [Eubacteriales bacterium OttesenSCG-928-M02]